MHFGKPRIRFFKLDVQETNCFAQFNKIYIHFLRRWIEIRLPALELWDLIVSVFGSVIQTSDRTVRLVQCDENNDSVLSNVQFSRQEALLCVFEDYEAVTKNDYQRQKSKNETRLQNPQSCS